MRPSDLVPVVCGSLPDIYVEKLLGFIATCLEKSGHLQFYMTWAQNLLMLHGQKLKNRCVLRLSFTSQIQFSMTVSEQKMTATNFFNASALACRSGAILPTLQALQKSIQRHFDDLSKL